MINQVYVAQQISLLVASVKELNGLYVALNSDNSELQLIRKEQATQYFTKKNHAIIVEIPELSSFNDVATAQLALAVGKRIERFERGAKANATRTPNSRKKIAQNAIKKRWSEN